MSAANLSAVGDQEIEDRPKDLRRRPRPAADENIDPVDFTAGSTRERGADRFEEVEPFREQQRRDERQPNQQSGIVPAASPADQSHAVQVSQQGAPALGLPRDLPAESQQFRRKKRESTQTISPRISVEVLEILDAAIAREGITQRAAVEEAIRHRWGNL